MFGKLEVQSSTQPDGGEVLATRNSVAARQGFKEAVRPCSIGQIVTSLTSRTAVVRSRMPGGVTGKAREGLPVSI